MSSSNHQQKITKYSTSVLTFFLLLGVTFNFLPQPVFDQSGQVSYENALQNVYAGTESIAIATSTQVWTVPVGVTEITVKTWGAGGGGAGGGTVGVGGSGGAGGYMEATIAVTPGEDLTVRVGGGGGGGDFSSGGAGALSGDGGGGGGYTALLRGTDVLVVAAGGGGGGGGDNSAATAGGAGGAGGNIAIAGGSSGSAGGGGGATVSSGGSGGTGGNVAGSNGFTLSGGSGADGNDNSVGPTVGAADNGGLNGGAPAGNGDELNNGFAAGGGGGGGYFGGGGGSNSLSGDAGGGGGGGGSSFSTSTALATSTEAGSGAAAPNTADEDYDGLAGAGGTGGATSGSGTAGTDGLLVIQIDGLEITGTVYENDRFSSAGSGIPVKVAVGSSSPALYTGITDASGMFVIGGIASTTISSTTPITVFVDADDVNDSRLGTTFTSAVDMTTATQTISGIDIYTGAVHFIESHNDQSIDLADSAALVYDNADDSDVLLDVTTATTTVSGDLVIASTTTLVGNGDMVLTGDFVQQGTYTDDGATLWLTGGAQDIIGTTTGSSALGNVVFDGASSKRFIGNASTSDITINGSSTFDLLGNYDPADTAILDNSHRIAVSGNYAYVTGDMSNNVLIIDISSSTNPILAGNYDPDDTAILNDPRDIAVKGDYAYVVGFDSNNVLIIDISSSTNPILAGNYDPDDTSIIESPQTISISGDYAYVANWSFTAENLLTLDISDPTNPTLVNDLDTSASIDTPYVSEIQNDNLYIIGRESGFHIFDISDPLNPILSDTITAFGDPRGMAVDGNYAYVPSTLDFSLNVIDISSSTNAFILSKVEMFYSGTLWSVDVAGDFVYAGFRSSAAPLVAVNVSDPANPFIADEFDTVDTTILGAVNDVTVAGDSIYVAGSGDNLLRVALPQSVSRPELLSIDGSLEVNNEWHGGNDTVYLTGTGGTISGTLLTGTSSLPNTVVTGSYTADSTASTTGLTIASGATLTAPTSELTIGGSLVQNGTFTARGTTTFTGLRNAFDVSEATNFDIKNVQSRESSASTVIFNNDGTKMYVAGNFNDAVDEWDLLIPYDVSTGVYVDTLPVGGEENALWSIAFNDDGTKLYVLGTADDAVDEWALSVPYDVSTGIYTDTLIIGGQETEGYGMTFNNDGTKLYIVGWGNDAVDEWALSPAYDVSTGVYTDTLIVSSEENQPSDVAFNADGTKLYVIGFQDDAVDEWTLSVPYDVSTGLYTDTLVVSGVNANPNGIAFSDDGLRMFLTNGNNADIDVWHMFAEVTGDITASNSLGNVEINGSILLTDTASTSNLTIQPAGLLFAPTTTLSVSGDYANSGTFQARNGEVVLSGVGSVDGDQTGINAFSSLTVAGSYTALATTTVNGAYTVTGSFDRGVTQLEISNALNQFEQGENFSVSVESPGLTGMTFNNDGTKMYTVEDSISHEINEWSLSTPFDVSTRSFTDALDISAQDTGPDGVAFNNDGTKMYVVGGAISSEVYEWALSVPFDVSTGVYTDSININVQSSGARGIAFNNDGSKMFIVDSEDKITEWALPTPYDVSTAVYTDSLTVSAQEGNLSGLDFSADGYKLYVTGYNTNSVYEWTLSTPFDVSTGTYTDYLDVVDIGNFISVEDIVFTKDYTKLYVVTSVDGIFEWESEAPSISGNLIGTSALGDLQVDTLAQTTIFDTASTSDLVISVGAVLVAPTTTLSITGDFTNNGTFTATTSEVIFNGTTQQTATGTLSGTSAFNNLTITNISQNGTTSQSVVFGNDVETTGTMTMVASTSAAFTAGATSTFQNVDWQGSDDSPVWLRATESGADWFLGVPGSQIAVEYVDVQDSDAADTAGGVEALDSVDSGNNTNWTFTSISTVVLAATSTDPVSVTVAPGGSATITNTFSFLTSEGTDVITDITIAHRNASSTSLIEITSADGSTVYGSVSNPTGTSSVITLSTNTLTATTGTTTYAVRVTPKSQANLPAGVFGSLIPVSFVVDSWSGTNAQLGSDSSFPVFIDNESLAAFGITGSSSFAVRVDYADELNIPAVSAADFDGDGYVDFASVGDESPGTVSVFINDGDGTFAARVEYTTDTNPVTVSYEDLDGDGDLDLFTTSRVTDKVSVLMNNGDGTFAAQVTYETGVTPYYVTSADIDNNGTPDLLVLNVASNTVSVLTNNGDGTFAAKVDYGVGDSSFGGGIDASDFDSDGYLDVVVGNGGDDTISILMNNGDGTFATEVTYATGPTPYSVAVADFDGDTDPDVVVANGFDQTVSVFIGAGDGTFATKVDYTVGFSPFSVRTADLDNDGDEDITTADFGENTISVLLNNGNGTFATKVGFVAGVSSVSPNAVADFNNDGFIDVVIGQSGFSSVLLNNSSSSLIATTSPGGFVATYTTPPQPDLNSVVFLASTSPVTTAPVDGTTYTGGEDIGGAIVACVDSGVDLATSSSCTASGLVGGVPYYLQAFVLDDSGNYSMGVEPAGSPVTPILPTEISWDGGGADDNWETPENWQYDTVPTAETNVFIDIAATVLLNGSTTINSLTIGSSTAPVISEIVFNYDAASGDPLIIDEGDLEIENLGVLTHANGSTVSVLGAIDVDVQTGDFVLNSGATIDLDGLGYTSGGGATNGFGPGTGAGLVGGYPGSGGAYGGDGGDTFFLVSIPGGDAYGSTTNPVQLGSSGGNAGSVATGGEGGGLALITVAGTTTIDGTVTANGTDGRAGGSGSRGGGGAGGGINITTGGFEGVGVIRANGGTSPNTSRQGGGGSGGRIAIKHTAGSTTNLTLQSYGGDAFGAGDIGAAGTIYVKTASQTYGDLFVSNNNAVTVTATPIIQDVTFDTVTVASSSNFLVPTSTTLSYTTLDIGNGGIVTERGTINFPSTFTVETGARVNFDRARSFDNLTINGEIGHSPNYITQEYTMNLNITGDFVVNSGGTIDLDGLGYTSGIGQANGYGPGAGASLSGDYPGGGGAYGGDGGDALFIGIRAGGDAYGSTTNPVQIGSSGGNAGAAATGGEGGGLALITVAGTTTIDGTVTADGADGRIGQLSRGGGGAGGGINLTTGGLDGVGVIRVNGGDSPNASRDGAGGSGGRIAIKHTTGSTTDFTIQAYGGNAFGAGDRGAAGTVFTRQAGQPHGDLTIDNNNLITNAATPLVADTSAFSVTDLTIIGNASATIPVTLALFGDYTADGTIDFGTGTTTFAGSSLQIATGTLNGLSAFNNVEVTNVSGTDSQSAPSVIFGTASEFNNLSAETAGVMLQFTETVTVSNFNILGADGDEVYLYSTESGATWDIDVTGTSTISYANVKDSDASGSTAGDILAATSTDSGNNISWCFGSCAEPAVEWNSTDWTLYDTITIRHENIDEPLTDFPVYVDLADLSSQFWSTIVDGGGDVRITTDAGTLVELAREVVSASTTLETGELHFKAPYLSEVIDTSFRIYYNGVDAEYTTDATYGAERVWSNRYVFVSHDGGETDSTLYDNDGTAFGDVTANNTSGQLGLASDFDGAGDWFDVGDDDSLDIAGDISVGLWFTTNNTASNQQILSKYSAPTDRGWLVSPRAGDTIRFEGRTGINSFQTTPGTTPVTSNQWTHFVGTRSGSLWESYTNSIGSGAFTNNDGSFANTVPLYIARNGEDGFENEFDGTIDEVRIASTSRSAAWIFAEYTNQSTSTDFYTITDVIGATGSSTISNHDAGQVTNAFNFQNKTNEPLYAFKVTPESGDVGVTRTELRITGWNQQQLDSADFTNIRLYRDLDNDAAYDVTDTLLSNTGTISFLRQNTQIGTLVFTEDFEVIAAENFLVVADWNAPNRGSQMNLQLMPGGLDMLDTDGPVTVSGSVDRIQHGRNNRGGGGGSSSRIGTAAPVGDGVVTGGDSSGGAGGGAVDTNTGGGLIGNDANFNNPTAGSGAWNNIANAYDQTDGTYATTSATSDADFTNYSYNVPGSNTINGIEVKLEVSGTTAAGNIAVSLSWDGGTSWTATKDTATLDTTDTVLSVGGATDLWGRTWTASDLSNANFAVRLTGAPSANEIRVDAIQVRVFNQATGGGGGGGGRI